MVPSAMSLAYSTVAMTMSDVSFLTAIWTSAAPLWEL